MPAPQSYKNHARYDPLFHFFVLPMLLINFILSIRTAIHHWDDGTPHRYLWYIVMSFVAFIAVGKARAFALKAQDRIIRLEERLRLASLLSAADQPRIAELTTRQLIALRFASDAEVAALALKAADQKLDPKTIKQSIVNWRPDYDRV